MKLEPQSLAAFNLKTTEETQSFQREERSLVLVHCAFQWIRTGLLEEAAPMATALSPPLTPHVCESACCKLPEQHSGASVVIWRANADLNRVVSWALSAPCIPKWCSINTLTGTTTFVSGPYICQQSDGPESGKHSCGFRMENWRGNARAECGAGGLRCILR